MGSCRELIERFINESRDLLLKVDQEAVQRFVDVLFAAWQRGNTTFLCGNGGSASTAQHMSADLFKCTKVHGKPGFRALCLNDNMPLISALTNDDGWGEVFAAQLRTWWQPGDVVLAISVHGGSGEHQAGPWSQNLLAACRHANDNGGTSLGLVGFDGGVMQELCTVSLVVRVDSTPQTEGLHPLLHHLITSLLHVRMQEG